MSFFTRLSNGWELSIQSLRVLRENKQLIIFPILSGISLLLIIGSFLTAVLAGTNWESESYFEDDAILNYLVIFAFYVVNYFIIVFFNMALIHCTRQYFNGEQVSVKSGLQFSMSRISAIFLWALFAATIGTILRIIQENVGFLGKILTSIVGIVWSIATFFVVPVIAYENKGPIEAFKRSASIMKNKWGESLASTFSFGLIQFLAIVLVALPLFIFGSLVNIFLGIALGGLALFSIIAVFTAAETIFISAVYHGIEGDPVKQFNERMIDNLFEHK